MERLVFPRQDEAPQLETPRVTSWGRWITPLDGVFVVGATTRLRLVAPLVWEDPNGYRYVVPPDFVTDGASIPPMLQPLVVLARGFEGGGGRFDGPWVRAAALHDFQMQQKTQRWENVHRRFYRGMRADGCNWVIAQGFFRAVWIGAERWKDPTGETR